MYRRVTRNEQELSEARRRAALSRRVHRGGRPKGWRKDPNAQPSRTLAVDPQDYGILKNYAGFRGLTVKNALHLLAAALVLGSRIPARPELKPDGWTFKRQ